MARSINFHCVSIFLHFDCLSFYSLPFICIFFTNTHQLPVLEWAPNSVGGLSSIQDFVIYLSVLCPYPILFLFAVSCSFASSCLAFSPPLCCLKVLLSCYFLSFISSISLWIPSVLVIFVCSSCGTVPVVKVQSSCVCFYLHEHIYGPLFPVISIQPYQTCKCIISMTNWCCTLPVLLFHMIYQFNF